MKKTKRGGRRWIMSIFSIGLAMGMLLSASGAWGGLAPYRLECVRSDVKKNEIKFMRKMIDHHAMAVEMAKLCEQKAVHDELKEMCIQMKKAQLEEIDQMLKWLHNWYDISYQPRIPPMHRKMMEYLAALQGADFEIAFMKMMIPHHHMAIRMSMRYYPLVGHDRLLDMMENIVEDQIGEMRVMRTWLCEWYGICCNPMENDEEIIAS